MAENDNTENDNVERDISENITAEKAKQLETRIIHITDQFLAQLGRSSAQRKISLDASLQHDLGIDSLGRVELFHQIEEAFGVFLSESVMIQAETLNDLATAVNQASQTQIPTTVKKVYAVETKTTFDPNQAQSLVEVLQMRAEHEPHRPHVFFQDEKGDEVTLTYEILLKKSSEIATGLQEKGITRGDTVALMLPTSEDFFFTFFGILHLGAIPVPIYPPFRPDRIEEYAIRAANILKNAEVKLLITFQKAQRLSELLRVFVSSLNDVVTVESLKKSTDKFKKSLIVEGMPALIQYTSGSTSAPKGVLLSHHNLLANIRSIGKAAQITSQDVAVSWLPLYHDMGLIGSWLMSLYHACPIVIMSPLSFLTRPEKWLWAIHYHRATISGAPNFAYELCIRRVSEAAIAGLDLSSWRLSFNGAEEISPSTLEGFIKKFTPYGYRSTTMFPVYGLAESAVALTFSEPNQEPKIDIINRDLFEKEQIAVPEKTNLANAIKFVCCGKPIPLHEIRIVNEYDEIVPDRVIGALQFRGPSIMLGYYRQPEATLAITHQGWLDSGDRAYMSDGAVYITGRQKDIIIKAGRNLHPDEIEEVTSQVSGIRKGCVVAFGVMDPKWGTEKLIIVAETREKDKTLHKKITKEINEKIATVLGILPDEVYLVAPKTIGKTSSGKLQRSACKDAYLNKKLFYHRWPVVFQVIKLYFLGLTFKLRQSFALMAKLLFTAYAALLTIIATLVALSAVFLLPYRWSSQCIHQLAKGILWVSGCRLKVKNKEKIPLTKPLVYVSNHASYLDSFVLLAILPPPVQFVAKKELLKVPILSSIIKKLKMITIDRVDFSSNIADTELITNRLKEGNGIAIFPEGTFTAGAGLRPFKLGAFKIAAEGQCPILPVAIKGTRSILRDDHFILQPGPIEVTIGELIMPLANDWQEVTRLHREARAQIAKDCGEQIIDV
ncbi:MAG: 1-acylglycerol-3-phosphate O-acyltransferase [Candidatus Berkiellales bacterium]